MKKKALLALMGGICLGMCGCSEEKAHTHNFGEEWKKDGREHWRVCTEVDCGEISEKAEHEWDDGELTVPATKETDGVKTYTCTVCLQTKTESVKYEPNRQVSQAGWIESFDAEALDNVTLTGEIKAPSNATIPMEIQVAQGDSYERMEFSDSNVWEAYYEQNGNSYIQYSKRTTQTDWTVTAECDFGYSGRVFLSLMPLNDKYGEFSYDPLTRCYVAGAMDCESQMFGTLRYESVSVQFEDGKVVWIKAIMKEPFKTTPTGTDIMEYEFSFAGYQSTVVQLPIVNARNTIVSAQEWETGFERATSVNVNKRILAQGGSSLQEFETSCMLWLDKEYSEWIYNPEEDCLEVRFLTQGEKIALSEQYTRHWKDKDKRTVEAGNSRFLEDGEWEEFCANWEELALDSILGRDKYAEASYNLENERYEYTVKYEFMEYDPVTQTDKDRTVDMLCYAYFENGFLTKWEGRYDDVCATTVIDYNVTAWANPEIITGTIDYETKLSASHLAMNAFKEAFTAGVDKTVTAFSSPDQQVSVMKWTDGVYHEQLEKPWGANTEERIFVKDREVEYFRFGLSSDWEQKDCSETWEELSSTWERLMWRTFFPPTLEYDKMIYDDMTGYYTYTYDGITWRMAFQDGRLVLIELFSNDEMIYVQIDYATPVIEIPQM